MRCAAATVFPPKTFGVCNSTARKTCGLGRAPGGLNRLSQHDLILCGAAQGLTNDFARGVSETAYGTLWVGTTGGGLYRGTLEKLEAFRPDPVGGYYAHVESVVASKDGSVWWGGANGLLQWRHDQLFACFTNEAWVVAASVTALQEDGIGGLWVGTSENRDSKHSLPFEM
jgi:hypothetical protein